MSPLEKPHCRLISRALLPAWGLGRVSQGGFQDSHWELALISDKAGFRSRRGAVKTLGSKGLGVLAWPGQEHRASDEQARKSPPCCSLFRQVTGPGPSLEMSWTS